MMHVGDSVNIDTCVDVYFDVDSDEMFDEMECRIETLITETIDNHFGSDVMTEDKAADMCSEAVEEQISENIRSIIRTCAKAEIELITKNALSTLLDEQMQSDSFRAAISRSVLPTLLRGLSNVASTALVTEDSSTGELVSAGDSDE